ncbi:MAG: hypothetical protein KDK22_17995, partial [Rhodobacteraceae bacterium]|nr:hypothetical protein [Paracoccaceae bacterium]
MTRRPSAARAPWRSRRPRRGQGRRFARQHRRGLPSRCDARGRRPDECRPRADGGHLRVTCFTPGTP